MLGAISTKMSKSYNNKFINNEIRLIRKACPHQRRVILLKISQFPNSVQVKDDDSLFLLNLEKDLQNNISTILNFHSIYLNCQQHQEICPDCNPSKFTLHSIYYSMYFSVSPNYTLLPSQPATKVGLAYFYSTYFTSIYKSHLHFFPIPCPSCLPAFLSSFIYLPFIPSTNKNAQGTVLKTCDLYISSYIQSPGRSFADFRKPIKYLIT